MYVALLLLPLLGALIAGFAHRAFGERAATSMAALAVATAAVLSWVALFESPSGDAAVPLMRWITSGDLEVFWSVRTDRLSLMMAAFITSLSAVVHVAVIGFNSQGDGGVSETTGDDAGRARLTAYLSLMTFALLIMATGDNLLQIIAGWEGVGVVAYLMTGFWHKRPRADTAALRVFVMNRVGQAALILALATIFSVAGSLQLDIAFQKIADTADQSVRVFGLEPPAWIAFMLAVGVFSRAAMVFFHTWPVAASEAPVPAFALLLGAVLVGCAVFLVCRLAPLFALSGGLGDLLILATAGSAVLAALSAAVQTDVLRLLGYLAAAKAGVILVGAVAGAFPAAMIHALSTGIALALLVLAAGLVLQAHRGERLLTKLGGTRHAMPVAYAMAVLGALSLTGFGIPLTGIGLFGHLSQEAMMQGLIGEARTVPGIAFALSMLAIAATAYAAFRLIFLMFHGEQRAQREPFVAPANAQMLTMVALGLLSVGAASLGMVTGGLSAGSAADAWWSGSLPVAEPFDDVPSWVALAPVAALLAGLALAFARHGTGANKDDAIPILSSGLYWDDVVEAALVRPASALGETIWRRTDAQIIDRGLGLLGPAHVPWLGRLAGWMQSGFLYRYALVLLAGLVVVLVWITLGGAR